MKHEILIDALRFYFVTDSGPSTLSVVDQASVAIDAGASTVQYRNKNFSLCHYNDLREIRALCHQRGVMFIVNDNVLLAKAVGADGIHLGQDDVKIALAREVLGSKAILGLSISTVDELEKSDIKRCNYIGIGPVFDTDTKRDAKSSHGLDVLGKIVRRSSVPTVAIGGINSANAKSCMNSGVDGVAVISCITRSDNPVRSAAELAHVCFNHFGL